MNCLFCKIINKELPANIVFENEEEQEKNEDYLLEEEDDS